MNGFVREDEPFGALRKYPESDTALLRGSAASYVLKFDARPDFCGAGEVEEAAAGLVRVGGASMSLGCARAECLSCMVK